MTFRSGTAGRWVLAGHFLSIFEVLQIEVDDDFNAIDGTYVRVHQRAAGGKGGPTDSALDEVVAYSLRRCMRVWMLEERRGKSK